MASCFINEDIFGPIPENVQSKIDSFSYRSDAKLTPKYTKRTGESFTSRGNNKRRGSVNSYNYNLPLNYPSSYYQGYNYGYDNPSTSSSGQPGAQVSQSSLFHETPRHRGSRGKSRKPRGRGRGRGRSSRN